MSKAEPTRPPTSPKTKVPKQIGKYSLIRKLGAGGMGAVFLSRDEKTNRNVALKVLPREKAANRTLVQRFRAEAQAAANLEHENIVRVYEADEADGFLYIALEYVDGTDVNCVLRKRERMPVKRTVEIVKQVALALQHAHQQNIVHRDIKPSNLMIRKDGLIKLTDLGLARSIDESDDTNITRAGTTVGTVDYMAPEQARSSRLADIRSDLYSLGCTWYQMLVGHPPYHLGSMTNKLQAHATSAPPDPREENPDVPESIAIMIQRLMAKKPDDRYQTPTELLEDLQNAHLHRQAPSDHLFSALASSDDDKSNTGTRSSAHASTSVDTPPGRSADASRDRNSAGEAPLIPPRDDSRGVRPQGAGQHDRGTSLSELLKYIVIASLVIGVFTGIWYIVTGFASGLTTGSDAAGESQRHIAEEMLEGTGATAPTVSSPRRTQINPQTQSEAQIPSEVQQVQLTWPERPAPSREISKTAVVNPEWELSVPNWAQSVPMANEIEPLFGSWKPHVTTVGRYQNKIGSHPSLNAAFSATDSGNLWIRLIGPGPFVLNPVRLDGRNVILSTDDVNIEPVIVCLTNPESPADHFLSLENGSLLMTGINLVLAAHHLPAEADAGLISVTRGDLFLRDVSMTLFGTRPASTAAITMKGGPYDESARILVDRSVIRGAWCAFDSRQVRMTALWSNCLLLTQDSPAIEVSGSASSSGGEPLRLGPNSRWLRLIQSTIVSSGPILSVRPGDPVTEPVPLTLNTEYSLLCSFPENESAMLALNDWPVGEDQPAELYWAQSQSVVAGWKSLVSADTPGFTPVEDIRTWNEFWNADLGELEAVAAALPLPHPVDSLAIIPQQWRWDSGKLPAGTVAGCPVNSIQLPGNSSQQTAAALTQFDDAMPAVFAEEPVETIELDLDRTNLQQRLSQTDWKSGTRFLLKGTKPNLMVPVEIDGRSLILEAAPGLPDSFRLEPRGSQSKPLISVRDGSLQLRNLRIKIPNRTRNDSPEWAVRMTNGSLLIEDCFLEGPYLANSNHRGLIYWETGDQAGRSLPASSPHRHLCSLRTSYLTTVGTTLALQPRQGIVHLFDSTLAARGSAVTLSFLSDPQSAMLDFRQSTFAASDSVFSITGTPNEQPRPVANCVVQRCVFAAPLPGTPKDRRPTLLEASAEWVNRRNFLWWEKANAYSTELPCFFRPAEDHSDPNSFDDWKLAWGVENVQTPLNSPDGVILNEDYPVRASIPPEFFQLDERSRALEWAPDGSAVGAAPADYIFLVTNTKENKQNKPVPPTSGF